MKVILVARVSHVDGSQSTDAQLADLKAHAEKNKWNVVHVIESKESVKYGRKDHGIFHRAIKEYSPDAFVFTEVCRISRSLLDLLLIIDFMHRKSVAIYILSFAGLSLNEDKTVNTSTMTMIHMQGLFAQVDTDLRSRRIKSGCEKGLKPIHFKKYCGNLSRTQAEELFKIKKGRFLDKDKRIKATDIRLAEIYNLSTGTINNFYNSAKKVGLKKYLDSVDAINKELEEKKLNRLK